MIALISAMDKNGLIGTGEGLPWHIKEEYQRYLNTVKGKTIIVGRKTFEISGKDLIDEKVLILSKSHKGDNYFADLASALKEAGDGEVFVTGGSTIYKEALPIADMMYLSIIKGEYEGNTYFPDFDNSEWTIIHEESLPEYDYYIYCRKT